MKTYILPLILLLIICQASVGQSTQKPFPRKNFIGLNMPGISWGIFNGFSAAPAIGYERSIGSKTSLGSDVTVYLANRLNGFMLRPEYRYYFKQDSTKRNKGWYVGAQTYYRYLNYNSFLNFVFDFGTIDIHEVGLNVVGGYQWVWKNNLFFTLGAGYGPPKLQNVSGDRGSRTSFFMNWTSFELFIRLGYSF